MPEVILDALSAIKNFTFGRPFDLEKKSDFQAHSESIRKTRQVIDAMLANRKTAIAGVIKSRYHRNWALSSLKLARKSLNMAEKLLDFPQQAAWHIQSAIRNVEHAKGLVRARSVAHSIESDSFESLFLKDSDLKEGDLILSYKTAKYHKTHFLSWLIKFATYSAITHVSMVCTRKDSSLGMMTSAADDVEVKGLSIQNLKPKAGEIFLILRMKDDLKKKSQVLARLKVWAEIAGKRTVSSKTDGYHFSELKCWIACANGLVSTTSMAFFGVYASFPNPTENHRGLFCSELVDFIFKEAGIILMPRAEDNAVLGPSDIMYSPHFDFKGIFGNREDAELMRKEKIVM